jgi:hypothetical protein
MLVSLTGVGIAADRAVPGDFLYPLDRALERVGLTSNLVEERLQEALILLERGELTLAIATANEALVELGRSGVTVSFPDIVQVTDDTLAEVATTTTNEVIEVAPPVEDEPSATQPVPEVVVEAAAEPASPGETLRLAAEQLLASVRSAKSDSGSTDNVVSAALFLAEATATVSTDEESEDTSATTTTTTTSSSTSTTTTTVADPTRSQNTNSTDSGTTTTTVTSDPDDGSDDSTGDGQDDPPGPIFLPSP